LQTGEVESYFCAVAGVLATVPTASRARIRKRIGISGQSAVREDAPTPRQ
jgi:hypothetical protein